MSNYVSMENEKIEEEEECLICFEKMNLQKELAFIKCSTCNMKMHEECALLWKKTKEIKNVKCMQCEKPLLLQYKYVNLCWCLNLKLSSLNKKWKIKPFN